jgi:hypothetical protein
MSIRKSLAALAACAVTLTGGTAFAQQNEIQGILNGSDGSNYLQLSYRRAISGDISEGAILRLDVARGTYDVGGSNGMIDTYRLAVGYRMPVSDIVQLTFYAGASHREREYDDQSLSPVFFPRLSETGVYAAVEINADLNAGGNAFGILEYDSTTDAVYAGGHWLFGFDQFQIGPEFNVLDEDGYSRQAAGLRATYAVSSALDLSVSAMWAENGDDEDENYLEFQLRSEF